MVCVKIIYNDWRKDNDYKTFKTKAAACDYLSARGFKVIDKSFRVYADDSGSCAKLVVV